MPEKIEAFSLSHDTFINYSPTCKTLGKRDHDNCLDKIPKLKLKVGQYYLWNQLIIKLTEIDYPQYYFDCNGITINATDKKVKEMNLQKLTNKETTMQKNCMHDASYRCPSCSTYTAKSNEEAELTELKLEVGKSYNLSFTESIMSCNPYKFLLIDDGDAVFRDSAGHIIAIYKSALNSLQIKEHREPYKQSGTYWFVYDPAASAGDVPLDILTGKDTTAYLYNSKEQALCNSNASKYYNRVAKIEITAVITEEQNAN